METKELRIGNYYLDFDDEIQQIEMIQPFMFGFKYRWEWTKYIKPIPLTEEILLKCGFDNWFSNEYCLYNGFFYMNLKFYKNGNIQLTTCGSSKKYLKGEIMLIAYLHQLQNLYFTLTNEELTVNL